VARERLRRFCASNLGIGNLPYHHKKTIALDAKQVQQLLISTMRQRPAYLRLYAFAQLLQMFPSHFGLPT
jgi:hypothetical protein